MTHVTRTWPRVDLRPSLPPVRDQGRRGTCTAFAVTAAHETAVMPGHLAEQALDLCEEVLHWRCRQGAPARQSGATLASARMALMTTGQPDESFWPYDEQRDEHAPHYVPPAGAIAAENCRRGALSPEPFTVAALAGRLVSGSPAVLGVRVGRLFASAPAGRVPDGPDPSGGGGHAILVVGYDELVRPEQGGEFIIRNSWGPEWGDQGYGYCSGHWLTHHLIGAEFWHISPGGN